MSRSTTAEYLLAGKLFCGHCKKAMQGISGTSKTGKLYYYYACPDYKKKRCEKKPVTKDYIEDLVVRLTVDFLLQEDRLREIAHKMYLLQAEGDTREEDLAQYRKKLKENKTASDNIMRAIEKGIAAETLLSRLGELEDERIAIEGEIAYLKSVNFGLSEDELEFFLRQFIRQEDESPEEYRKKIIKCFVTKVFLYNDRLQIQYSLTKDGNLLESDAEISESSSSDASGPVIGSLFEHSAQVKILIFRSGIILEAPA